MTIQARFSVSDADRLRDDGAAVIYALPDDRVLRVAKPGAPVEPVRLRAWLLTSIRSKAKDISFRIPEIIDLIDQDDEIATIEPRLPGEPLSAVLANVSAAPDRRNLVRAYLLASREIGRLSPKVEFYGDLLREENIRAHRFTEYAIARAHASLRAAGDAYAGVSGLTIADSLPEAPGALIHLDFCPQNVLVEAGKVTAVLGFSDVPIIGDRRFEPISAALYLDPAVTPSATDEDRALAMTWLEANELTPLVDPVRRWLAAFWAGQPGDAGRLAWARAILLDG